QTLVAADRLAAVLAAINGSGDLTAALVEAEAILAGHPQSAPALMVRAAGMERAGEHSAAREIYENILSRDDAFAPASRRLAWLYSEYLGDDAKAEDYAIRARRVFVDDADLAYVLGSISYRRADYPEAIRFLRQSVRQRNDYAQ